MGRAKAVTKEGTNLGGQSKENIQWAGSLDTQLVYRMKEEWGQWRPGEKVSCGKRWAKAIGVDMLDKSGTKTKAHVEQLVNRWKSATVMMGAGCGNKTRMVKMNGQWITEIITAKQMIKEKCPDFDTLDSFLSQREVQECLGDGVGESGMANPVYKSNQSHNDDSASSKEVIKEEEFKIIDGQRAQAGMQFQINCSQVKPQNIITDELIDPMLEDLDISLGPVGNFEDTVQVLHPKSTTKLETILQRQANPQTSSPTVSNKRPNRPDNSTDNYSDNCDLEPESKRMRNNLQDKIQAYDSTKKKKGGPEFSNSMDSVGRLLSENMEMRKERLRLEELKDKARVAKRRGGGVTDEDREHQLKMQQMKLKHDLDKQKLTLRLTLQIEEMKLRQIQARNNHKQSFPHEQSSLQSRSSSLAHLELAIKSSEAILKKYGHPSTIALHDDDDFDFNDG